MAAVITMPGPGPTSRQGSLRPGARRDSWCPAQTHRRRRRRAAAVVCGLAIAVVAGKAGAALGGSSLAVPERRPAPARYVVQPGDSLWSIAQHLEPGHDPRPVVDALANARDRVPLLPGEVVVWDG